MWASIWETLTFLHANKGTDPTVHPRSLISAFFYLLSQKYRSQPASLQNLNIKAGLYGYVCWTLPGYKPQRHRGPYNVMEIYSLISYLRQSKPQALEALLIDSAIYRYRYIRSVSIHMSRDMRFPTKWYSSFILPYFTAEYRLLPNPKEACIFPILDIFSQPEDFIGIYSRILKAQAVSPKRQ